jgi:signal transduction histidine kinase
MPAGVVQQTVTAVAARQFGYGWVGESLDAGNPAIRASVQYRAANRRDGYEWSGQPSAGEAPSLSAMLMTMQETERKRIAGDLHDSIGQSLSALRFGIGAALDGLRKGNIQVAGNILEKLAAQAEATIVEVQRIAMDLRPAMLDDIGLVSTLAWFCREFQTIHPDLALNTDIEVDERDIAPTLRTNIFRLIQEALSNIVKHAGASEILLRLRRTECELHLVVADNGTGSAPERSVRGSAAGTGAGLKGMRERAEISGGRFSLVSVPARGTTICVAWSLHSG